MNEAVNSAEDAWKSTEETFSGFIASTAALQQTLSSREITDIVFDVCSHGLEELMRKIKQT
jgi:hypothetical protein